jgi:hypothetical protein
MSSPRGRGSSQVQLALAWMRVQPRLSYIGFGVAAVLALAGRVLPRLATPLQILALVVLLVSVVALRRDVLTLGVIAATGIIIDYYQLIALPKGFPFVALLTMLSLIAILWVERRAERPWLGLPDLPLWGILLVLVALAIPRSVSLTVGAIYFLEVIVAAFGAWILGTVVILDADRLRQLLTVLTVLGVFIAIHSLLNSPLGIFLFDTPKHHAYLATQHYFYLLINHRYHSPGRASSFLLNPDSDGAFLAMSFFLPAGLFFAARSYLGRAVCLASALVILIALLYTDTAAAWAALLVGILVLVGMSVRLRQAALALGGVLLVGGLGLLALRSEVHRLLQHATGADELSLRVRVWQVALRVIRAHPLTGIGLGTGQPYITRTAPYAIGLPLASRPHPHNSFLELAALAGIPVLLVYLVILLRAGWRAVKNYRLAGWESRPLFAGVFAALVALSVHGLADATWTLPPLVPIAWLLLGAVSSRQLGESVELEQLSAGKSSATPVRYPASAGSPDAAQQTGAQESGDR